MIPIISQNLTRIREACARHGVKRLSLLEELEAILQQPIDLVERATLRNPYLFASINRSEQPLYVYAA